MPRVKRGVEANRRHKKILKQAKGYYGARSRVYRVAVQAVTKAGQYAYPPKGRVITRGAGDSSHQKINTKTAAKRDRLGARTQMTRRAHPRSSEE